MSRVDPLSPMEIVKVTLMVAVGAFALRWLSQTTGIGTTFTRHLP